MSRTTRLIGPTEGFDATRTPLFLECTDYLRPGALVTGHPRTLRVGSSPLSLDVRFSACVRVSSHKDPEFGLSKLANISIGKAQRG